MKTKFYIFFILIICVAIQLLFMSCETSKDVKYEIGVVLSLTGRGATFGQRALKGMELAVNDINNKEPFKSNPLILIVEDSQSSASGALSAFRKLVDINNVEVVVGLVLSDEVLTCAPVANKEKVVLLTTAAGSEKIKEAGDYIFRNRESASLQANIVASAAVNDFGYKEIGILHSNAANGISYRDNFTQAIQKLGGQIVVSVGYNEGKNDYRAEIEELRAKSPKAVYLAGLDTELGLILKQSMEVGFATQFFGSPGVISEKLLEIARTSAEGLISAKAAFDPNSEEPRVLEFVRKHKERVGEVPDFIAANSYDAISILATLFKKNFVIAEEIKDALYSVKDYPGVGGHTTFDSYGEVTKPLTLVKVQMGEFKPL